jgi:integrase
MARGIEKLSARFVETVKKPGMYGDGGGLWLQVTAATPTEDGKPRVAKSWVFRFTSPTLCKPREMGLGAFHTYSLAEARGRARYFRQMVKEGADPIEKQKTEKLSRAMEAASTITFRVAAESFIELQEKTVWTHARSAEQWRNSLATYAYPTFGDWPVQRIDDSAVIRVLEPIWTEKRVTADRVRGRIESILDWCAVRGYRPKGHNPAAWSGHLEHSGLPAISRSHVVEHFPALPYAEIPAFIQKLRERVAISARCLEFLILTAMRPNAVLQAKFSEIDDSAAVWTVPAERMKGRKTKRREHRVPLSDRALELVAEMHKIALGDFIFPNATLRGPLSDAAMGELLERMDKDGVAWTDKAGRQIVPHGFRSTFRDWAADMTAYPREICELALAHTIGNRTEEAYQRSDLFEKRRRLMADWAAYCDKPAKPEAGTVTDFAAARQARVAQ